MDTHQAPSGAAAALLRHFTSLPVADRLDAFALIRDHLAEDVAHEPNAAPLQRREALSVLRLAALELHLPSGRAPTAHAFNGTAAAARTGWTAARVRRVFGRWSFACDDLHGRRPRQTAAQRATERAARRGVFREREDYLQGMRLWLESDPVSRTSDDYEMWRKEYNAALPPGAPLVVSYSMLRKAFRCSWSDLIEVALGRLSLAEAEARTPRHPLNSDAGPDDLVSFAYVRERLQLSTTSAQRRTRMPNFPQPVYTHPRSPRVRLWLRADIDAHVRGEPTERATNTLQDRYLDAVAVAALLGLARITVTTGSSPRVPPPAVRLAGLQLWLRDEIEGAATRPSCP